MVIAACFSYFIYPVILIFLIKIRNNLMTKASDIKKQPILSLIITAYNEENNIGKKLENSLAIDYPVENMEIIVASDCSTDETDNIVISLGNRLV